MARPQILRSIDLAIGFIANKDLTINFERIAAQLRDQGETIVWLSPSKRWALWLQSKGWPSQDILDISDHQAEWLSLSSKAARELAAPFETDPSLTVAHAILMCRGLSLRPSVLGEAYLAVSLVQIDRFLRAHNVELLLGEGTWGFEIAAGMVCRTLKIPHLCPSSMRIPSDRFGFVDAITSALWNPFRAQKVDLAQAAAFLKEWRDAPRPPSYATNSGYAAFDRAWINEAKLAIFKPDLDRGDETLWPISRRIKDRLLRAWRAKRISSYLRSEPVQSDLPYLLICLQHQPEAAVDVFGGFNSDQEKLIELIARMAPARCEIIVREHRGAIGDRPASWYRRVAALPKVRFSDPFAPIYPLLKSAGAVITVSSTVAFEAALLDTPALLLAPVHYAGLAAVPPTRMASPLDWPLSAILDKDQRSKWVPKDADKIALLADIIANSTVGEPALLRADPEITGHPEYLKSEAAYFACAIGQFRRRKKAGELVLGY
jgi:Capsule polysaccharide biosynthesis protein